MRVFSRVCMRRGRGRGLAVACMLALGAAALAAVVWIPPAAASSHSASVPDMIAVLDQGNERVQVFHLNGSFAFVFGGSGGQETLAVGPDGRVMLGPDVYHPNGMHAFRLDGGLGGGITPYAFDVGPGGWIAVADGNYNERVQVFNPDGSFAFAFGSRTGEDVIRYASDVAVGPDGRIAVLDGLASRVRVFGPGGSPVFDMHSGGSTHPSDPRVAFGPDGQIASLQEVLSIYRPNGTDAYETQRLGQPGFGDVAFAPDGRIVVADYRGHRVLVYHPNGSLATSFGSHGIVSPGFYAPTDVAVAPDGRIVVAEPKNYNIRVFHPNGTAVLEFGSHGASDGDFYAPSRVAVAPDGRIVVGDTVKERVQVFNPDGSPVLAFGSHGEGEGEFRFLSDVAVAPDGRIVVGDYAGPAPDGRVQVFHPNGSIALHIPLVDNPPRGVAVAPDGRIVVLSSFRVLIFHPNGTADFTIPAPTHDDIVWSNVAVAPDGRIVLGADGHISILNPDGSIAFATSTNILSDAVAVGPDGRIVVIDASTERVQVFNPDGSHAFAIRPALAEGRFNGPLAVGVGPLVNPYPAVAPPVDLSVDLGSHGGFGGPGGGGGPPVPHNFTDAGDAANVTIDVRGLAGPGGSPLNGSGPITVVFPSYEGTFVTTSFAMVSFPPGVTASHVPADGLLVLRVAADGPTAEQAQAAFGRNGTEIVLLQRVVEVGAEGSRVMFDIPVRISLAGQDGGRAFWVEGAGANGTITPIDEECVADDTAAVHAQLGGSGECQVDDPGGKIVYTYHLTKFGTVASAGPAPQPVFAGSGAGDGRTNGTATPQPPTPNPVSPTVSPPNGTDGGDGGVPMLPAPVVHTCSVSLGSPNLDLRATAGGYSDPVQQALRNTGSLALERVELGATTWKGVGPLPAPAPAPSIPPPVVGTDAARTSAALTAVLVAGLPASVTEVSTDEGGAAPYAPLANGTAVAHGLEGGAEEPIWFRMNLSDRAGMQGGTFVQTITYQAQCAPP